MALSRIALLGFALTFLLSVSADAMDQHAVVSRDLAASNKNAETALGLAKSCYEAFVKNVPPTFCYKKGGDLGKIPTQCGDGYFRFGLLCHQTCKDGYHFVLGVCWENCPTDYRNDGLTCYKSFYHWFFKKSYIPSTYGNFDSRVPCDEGMHKVGALCYRDCNKVGLLNCGIEACAATKVSCASTIATMAIDGLMAIGQTALLIFTEGGAAEDGIIAAEVRATVEQGFKKLGLTTIKESVNIFKTVIAREGKEAFFKQMTQYVLKKGLQQAGEGLKMAGEKITEKVVQKVCEEVGNKMLDQVSKSSGEKLNLQNFAKSVVNKFIGPCLHPNTTNTQFECVQTVLNDIAIVDPTGFVGFAASVLQPICNDV